MHMREFLHFFYRMSVQKPKLVKNWQGVIRRVYLVDLLMKSWNMAIRRPDRIGKRE